MNKRKAHLARLMMFAAVGYLAVGSAFAQSTLNDPGSVLPTLTPEKTISFDADVRIDGMYPSADGLHIYAQLSEPTLNIWSIFIYYTPEYMLVILGLLLLVCFSRLFRGRSVVGYPHCKKCRYLLVNHTGETCPECGAALGGRNRAFGRPIVRRMILVGLICILGGGAYFLGRERWVFQGSISKLMRWDSRSLVKLDLIKQNSTVWRYLHGDLRIRIVRIDSIQGDIETIRSMEYRDRHWLIDPTGRVMTILHTDRIEQFDVETGKLLRQVIPGDEGLIALMPDRSRRIVSGEEPHVLYMSFDDGTVYRWDLQQGEIEKISKLDPENAGSSVALKFLDQRKQLAIRTLGNRQAFNWQLWDAPTGTLQPRREIPGLWPFIGFLLSPDDDIVYTGNFTSHEIEGFNLASGEQVLKTEAMSEPVFPVTIAGEGRFLIAGVRGTSAYIYDLKRKAWVAQLGGLRVMPTRGIDLLGKDKIMVYGSVLGRPGTRKDLLIYDLSSLLTED